MRHRFALVGCGSIAARHAHVISEYLENGEIVAFCDIIPGRAQAFAQKYGGKSFTHAIEMVNTMGDQIDVINVLTPSGTHMKNVLDLAPYGKALIVEKPIALRLEEADRMITACALHGCRLFVVHQNHYNPPIVAARKALEEGRFGRLVLGTVRVRWKRDQSYYDSATWRGTWAYDGGVFTNQSSHHIDMLTWFMGHVESVNAIAATRLVKIECEDTGAALLRFTNGALGIVEATTATRPKDLEGSISVLGEKGSVMIGGYFMNELITWQFADHQPIDEVVFEKYGRNPEVVGYNLGEYLKDVLSAIETNRPCPVDGSEGRRSLELISAIYESIETGATIPVTFVPKKCKLGVA